MPESNQTESPDLIKTLAKTPAQDLTHMMTIPRVLFYKTSPRSPLDVKIWQKCMSPVYTHVCIEIEEMVISLPSRGKTQFIPSSSYHKPDQVVELSPVFYMDVMDSMDAVRDWSLSRIGCLRTLVDPLYTPRNCTTMVCFFMVYCIGGFPLVKTPDQLAKVLDELEMKH